MTKKEILNWLKTNQDIDVGDQVDVHLLSGVEQGQFLGLLENPDYEIIDAVVSLPTKNVEDGLAAVHFSRLSKKK